MSEYETIANELKELKGLVKTLIQKDAPKEVEWLSAEETCEILHIKPATLASYRTKRMIEFRSPRPFQYSVESIEKIQKERTIKKVM